MLIQIFTAIGVFSLGLFAAIFLNGLLKGIDKAAAPVLDVSSRPTLPTDPCAWGHSQIPIDVREVYHNDQPHTVVLMRCDKCQSHMTALHMGSWPLEDFLKRQSDTAGEIATLKRMAL